MLQALLLSALLPCSAPANDDASPKDETPRTWNAVLGALAPDFELASSSGARTHLADLRGKTVVLEWFNPDCPVVRQAHGEGGVLATLGNRLDAREDVVWLAINSGAPGKQGAGAERNEKARAEMGLEYPVLLDETGWVGRAYGATTTPHVFVIDAAGVLAYAGGHQDGEGRDTVTPAVEASNAGARPQAAPKNFGCGVKYEGQAKLGLAAPDFALARCGAEDETVRLADLRGSVVVLEWFNPTCPFVQRAHGQGGALSGAAARWAERGVAWLAINSAPEGHASTGQANLEAAEGWGMAYPILLDPDGKIGRRFEAKTTPHVYVLDPRGVLVYAGACDADGKRLLDQALEEVLAGKAVSVPSSKPYGCPVKYADQ